MTRKYWLTALFGVLATTACGDDSTSSSGTDTDTDGTSSTTDPTGTTTMTTDPTATGTTTTTTTSTTDPSTTTDPTATTDETTGPPPPDEADFIITIENVSADTWYPTPFSPGVWVEHTLGSAPMFAADAADAGLGMVPLAEDGDPATIAAGLDGAMGVVSVGSFDTPMGAGAPGPIGPGGIYEFTITAQQGSRLSLATMLVESNDIFLGTGPQGVALFTNSGFPQDSRDITQNLEFWDVGSEANQPPLGGDYQAPRQAAADTGPDEAGVVSVRSESTHQIPQAARLASVDVTYDIETEEYTIVIDNLSDTVGAMSTNLSGAVWALHDSATTLFTVGGTASSFTGLESLAEDGDPAAWQTDIMGSVDQSGVTAGAGLDEQITIVVNPNAGNGFFSFATMVVESNDAFIANATGVALLNDMDGPRPTADIETDFENLLAVWDAGTELNETPGVGLSQPGRQADVNTGTDDTTNTIRYYNDPTNDLASPQDAISVVITNTGGGNTHQMVINNNSDLTPYPFTITPVVWAVHDGSVTNFTLGTAASASIESLAEDGDEAALAAELAALVVGGTVSSTDVNDGVSTANIAPGDTMTIDLDVDMTTPNVMINTMVVPSNDTFLHFDVSLFNGAVALDDGEIITALDGALTAYDAGTEVNQCGAIGRDQAPRQADVDTGADEGNGLTQAANDKDPVWVYPDPTSIVTVTVAPVE